MDTVEIPAGPGVLAARQAMLEDEHGAELLYHLARHPKELEAHRAAVTGLRGDGYRSIISIVIPCLS